ncbi:hypothetical protein RND81_07G125300 [Saponaria officinalis]|uniref:Reverse transcriptase zinc-binding domain-containing protein n=1 Tax=Saponaria officinalis TaxID=3572 RepID=A0AAW1JMT9_SAPOF
MDTKESRCIFCNGEDELESLSHIFRDCDFVCRIWAASSLGINSKSDEESSVQCWVTNWFNYLAKRDDQERSLIEFLALAQAIWDARNEIRFGRASPNPNAILKRAEENGRVAAQGRKLRAEKMVEPCETTEVGLDDEDMDQISSIRNGPPSLFIGIRGSCPMLQVKVDAAWTSNQRAAIGWVVIDAGMEIFAWSRRIWAQNSIQAEAIAL